MELNKGELCFTYCQVPIIYKQSEKEEISVEFNNGTTTKLNYLSLDKEISKQVFERIGGINRIMVSIKK